MQEFTTDFKLPEPNTPLSSLAQFQPSPEYTTRKVRAPEDIASALRELGVPPSFEIDQPSDGYRFAVDPLLLVSQIEPQEGELILDIGTGCGVIPLLLAYRYRTLKICAVEIQNELAQFAGKNINENSLSDAIQLFNCDICKFGKNEKIELFDRVVSNPPYKKEGTGRLNPDIRKAIARHELKLTLGQLVASSFRLLKNGGIMNIVYPSSRCHELLEAMNSYSIYPSEVIYFDTNCNFEPKLVMVSGIKRERLP